jgi:hypothetical protein
MCKSQDINVFIYLLIYLIAIRHRDKQPGTRKPQDARCDWSTCFGVPARVLTLWSLSGIRNRIHVVLFGMQNRTFGLCFACSISMRNAPHCSSDLLWTVSQPASLLACLPTRQTDRRNPQDTLQGANGGSPCLQRLDLGGHQPAERAPRPRKTRHKDADDEDDGDRDAVGQVVAVPKHAHADRQNHDGDHDVAGTQADGRNTTAAVVLLGWLFLYLCICKQIDRSGIATVLGTVPYRYPMHS